ncbi:ras-like protein 2 [Parasitella parasitica]|nr:ras-like protein 2 [Parasitella parasitica]
MSKAATVLLEYKIAMVGDGGVGKSAMTIQFTQSQFVDEYDPTIEDSYRKQCLIDNHSAMLDILDTAGQEEYSAMSEQYMRDRNGFVLVYSITSIQSFERIKKFYEKIAQVKDGEPFTVILIGNKCDLAHQRQVLKSDGDKLAKEYNCRFLEASAKQRIKVDETFYELVRDIRNTKVEEEKEESFCCIIM